MLKKTALALTPFLSLLATFEEGLKYENNCLLDKAAFHYENALKGSSDPNLESHLLKAWILSGQPEKVLKAPFSFREPYWLGRAYEMTGNEPDAKVIFSKISSDPNLKHYDESIERLIFLAFKARDIGELEKLSPLNIKLCKGAVAFLKGNPQDALIENTFLYPFALIEMKQFHKVQTDDPFILALLYDRWSKDTKNPTIQEKRAFSLKALRDLHTIQADLAVLSFAYDPDLIENRLKQELSPFARSEFLYLKGKELKNRALFEEALSLNYEDKTAFELLSLDPNAPLHPNSSPFIKGYKHYVEGKWQEALKEWEKDDSPLFLQEKQFLSIKAKEKTGTPQDELFILREAFLQGKKTSLTPQVSFELYPFREYLYGDKKALKHLSHFKEFYPESPLTITACYLLGLNLKKDRKRGSQKNLNEACDLFLEAETRYQNLPIPEGDKTYYLTLKNEAVFERAKTLYQIALEGSDTKKEIFLRYGIDLLKPFYKELPISDLKGKTGLFLAGFMDEIGDLDASDSLLNELLKTSYSQETLSLALYEKGKIEIKRNKLDLAMNYLEQAIAKGLPEETLLDAYLIKSETLEKQNDLDGSIFALSEAINQSVISSKRVEAMYKRALVYEKQGRFDLARRQLESTKNKGGEWAKKALERWETQYAIKPL